MCFLNLDLQLPFSWSFMCFICHNWSHFLKHIYCHLNLDLQLPFSYLNLDLQLPFSWRVLCALCAISPPPPPIPPASCHLILSGFLKHITPHFLHSHDLMTLTFLLPPLFGPATSLFLEFYVLYVLLSGLLPSDLVRPLAI